MPYADRLPRAELLKRLEWLTKLANERLVRLDEAEEVVEAAKEVRLNLLLCQSGLCNTCKRVVDAYDDAIRRYEEGTGT